MKIYISEDRTRGRFTGVSNSPSNCDIATIETDHGNEVIQDIKELQLDGMFEENGVLFSDLHPDTVISHVRDFIWKKYREQGIIELLVS